MHADINVTLFIAKSVIFSKLYLAQISHENTVLKYTKNLIFIDLVALRFRLDVS